MARWRDWTLGTLVCVVGAAAALVPGDAHADPHTVPRPTVTHHPAPPPHVHVARTPPKVLAHNAVPHATLQSKTQAKKPLPKAGPPVQASVRPPAPKADHHIAALKTQMHALPPAHPNSPHAAAVRAVHARHVERARQAQNVRVVHVHPGVGAGTSPHHN